VTAMAGTHVCLRRVEAKPIYAALAELGVTHMCGAPIVMTMLLNAAAADRRELPRAVEIMTAGSAPPAAVIEGMERLGFKIIHVYGLTEVYGPAVVCAWHEEWDAKPPAERAGLKARQGVTYPVLEGLMVADPETLAPVAKDGATLGEIFMRGNIVMKGYLKNPTATEEAFAGGWFHTGDLGVWHADGYVALKDRSKDIIISGGENISTIEVESVLYQHPAVMEEPLRVRDAEARAGGHRGGGDRVLPRAPRALQGAADRGLRPTPQDLHRQDPEIRTPHPSKGARLRLWHLSH
jgi:fatty-acyl-CoA synthase